jgi:branched-chain amino acid transport system ATP-binding protein
MPTNGLLEIRNLSAGYGDSQALFDVKMDVAEGELVAVIGSNGAGKTTLMRTITGLVPAWAGAIIFDGEDIKPLPPNAVVAHGIAHSPEGRRVFPALTVFENLRLGAYLRRKQWWQDDLERVYAMFPPLKERATQPAGTLSGGEQQMLAIGRALMSSPRLLLLDEPSLGLAPVLVEQVMEAVQNVATQGTTTILVEQNANWGLAVADRAYVLESGHIVHEGSAKEIADDESVREAYLGV